MKTKVVINDGISDRIIDEPCYFFFNYEEKFTDQEINIIKSKKISDGLDTENIRNIHSLPTMYSYSAECYYIFICRRILYKMLWNLLNR